MGQGGSGKGFKPAATGSAAQAVELLIRYGIGTGATQDSATSIPAGFRAFAAWLEVVTPFSPGATIKIGQAGSLALLQATTDNNPQAAGIYSVEQDTDWGAAALPVRTTVGGAPAAGAGFVVVRYGSPLP